MAADSARYPQLEARALHDDENLCLYAIVREGVSDHHVPLNVSSRQKAWLYRLDGKVPTEAAVLAALRSGKRIPEVSGLWLLLVWDKDERTLSVVTDRLGGAWLYAARHGDTFAFSSDFGALARLTRHAATTDMDTSLLALAFGYSPDERTVSSNIETFQAGTCTELSARGRRVVSRRDFDFGDSFARIPRRDKFRVLDEIFAKISDERLLRQDAVLSLSAGFDSRYALGLLQTKSLQLPLATFGDPLSEEVDGARRVASRAGATTSLFHFEDTDWRSWARCVGQLGITGMAQWSGWAEQWLAFLREMGGAVIIGYLGDAISGKHLHPSGDATADWLTDWIRFSIGPAGSSNFLLDDAKARLRVLARDRFADVGRRATYAKPHQLALYLDLCGRQSRWVASQPNLMARFVTPVTFFCDDELIDFWMNVDLEDLLGQKLYLEYARSRFPKLFPQGEGSRSLVRRALGRARHLRRWWSSSARAEPRPPVVDRRRIVSQNKERILSLVDTYASPLSALLDVNSLRSSIQLYREDDRDADLALLLISITNLLLILSSAQEDSIPS